MNKSMRFSLLLAASVAFSLAVPNIAWSFQDTKTRAESKESKTAGLGVGLAPVHSALKAHLGKIIGKDRGVMITSVTPNLAADNAGLKPFDILCTYDGKEVSSPEQLAKLVRDGKIDDEVTLEYVNEGMLKKAKVKLSAMPEVIGRKLSRRTDAFWPIEDWIRFDDAVESDDAPSVSFEALTIKKLPGDKYMARIEFLDKENKKVEREFSGTIGDVRRAIRSDKELSRQQQQHLLRTLQGRSIGEDLSFGPFNWNANFGF
jgi:hypothetical protein